ncbi:Alpha/Beta hydrolase protein [Melampsora americana]|nr:Alpha/Beta hydrolase protein [Melampsora americana]
MSSGTSLTSTSPSIPLVLSLIIGLPITLYSAKSLALIIFQRRIIYLPYLPPNSRHHPLAPTPLLNSLKYDLLYLPSTPLSPRLSTLYLEPSSDLSCTKLDGIIYYLQGNAGNPIGRLDLFRHLLLPPSSSTKPLKLGLFALAPRGYWNSSGPFPFPFTCLSRPSHRLTEAGVVIDYQRGLDHLLATTDVPIWLLGHSLGAAAAVQLLYQSSLTDQKADKRTNRVRGLILENPLPSIRKMVKVLYPSPYVPYHYLGPFVRDKWDTIKAFNSSHHQPDSNLSKTPLLVLQSERDELVPPSLTSKVFEAAIGKPIGLKDDHLNSQNVIRRYRSIPRALHDDAYTKPRYRLEIFQFIRDTMLSHNT